LRVSSWTCSRFNNVKLLTKSKDNKADLLKLVTFLLTQYKIS